MDTFFHAEQNVTEHYVNTGGIYLLPEPVPFDTKIDVLSAYGFPGYIYNFTMDLDLGPFIPKPSEPDGEVFLFFLVYRPTRNGSVYSLAHNLMELRHGNFPGRLPRNPARTLNWEVQKGDFIGVYIP